jgi:site-specific recombinase XerC
MTKQHNKKLTQQEKNTPLNDFEVSQLFSYIRTQANIARRKGTTRPLVDEIVFELLFNAGLRPKEMCQLNISDTPVCLNRSVINVRSDEKHRAREISIPDKTDEVVRRFIMTFGRRSEPDTPLLLSERGNRFGYVSIYNKTRRVGEQAGLPGINPNRLRKTYISRLFQKAQDLTWVQQQAGHAHPKTTALYVQPAKVLCHACDREIADNRGQLIDSGQLLCFQCLEEFRA